jgi:GNAT superfamily N-acetyltransferase
MESTPRRGKVNKIGPIALRPASVDDAETLLRLLRVAFAEYEGVLDPPSGAHQETIDSIRKNILKGGAVIASVADEPAAFAFYRPLDDVLYFARLSVLPQFRNHGIGTALLNYVERHAKNTGAAGVSLGVRLQLPHLLARYERLGYRITDYMTHDGYAEPTWVYMVKRFN